jgi:hypothetical protein
MSILSPCRQSIFIEVLLGRGEDGSNFVVTPIPPLCRITSQVLTSQIIQNRYVFTHNSVSSLLSCKYGHHTTTAVNRVPWECRRVTVSRYTQVEGESGRKSRLHFVEWWKEGFMIMISRTFVWINSVFFFWVGWDKQAPWTMEVKLCSLPCHTSNRPNFYSMKVVSTVVVALTADMSWSGVWGGYDTDVSRTGMCTTGFGTLFVEFRNHVFWFLWISFRIPCIIFVKRKITWF